MIVLCSVLLFLVCGCAHNVTQSSGDPIRPDAKLTPGDTVNAPVEVICVSGYSKSVRNVTDAEKRAVFVEYFGRVPTNRGDYEIDHLISLELGGSNSIKNLWPQTYRGTWNAHVKDRLEDAMAAQVRKVLKSGPQPHDVGFKELLSYYGEPNKFTSAGHYTAAGLLKQYQMDIAHDWISSYRSFVSGGLIKP